MAEEEIKTEAPVVEAKSQGAREAKSESSSVRADAGISGATNQKATKVKGKKGKKIVPAGEVHIKATFNNTIISVSDKTGGILAQSSAGANGFRGSKKGTAYAAGIAAEKALETAKKDHGLSRVDVFVKGIGLGRDSAIRAVSTVGIKIDSITDVTPIAHGGVRPKGERKP